MRTIGQAEIRHQTGLGRAVLMVAGTSAVGLFLTLMIAGVLIRPWWWPVTGFVVGVVANIAAGGSTLARVGTGWIVPLTIASAALTALAAYH